MFLHYSGKKIWYERTGAGEALLLLHGFMEDHHMWKDWILQLEKHFTVVQVDLPGHGQSDTLGSVHTMAELSDILFRILQSEGIQFASICGHSLGGYVGLEMMHAEPKRVQKLVMLHSTALPDTDIKKKERDRVIRVLEMSPAVFIREAIPNLFAADNREPHAAAIDALLQIALQHPVDGLIATTRGMRDRADRTDMLQQKEIPVLMIIGEKDPVIPMSFYDQQRSLASHQTFVVSKKAGHMGHIEDPEFLFNAVLHFLHSDK